MPRKKIKKAKGITGADSHPNKEALTPLEVRIQATIGHILISPQLRPDEGSMDEHAFHSPEDFQRYTDFLDAAKAGQWGDQRQLYEARIRMTAVRERNPLLFARFYEPIQRLLRKAIETGTYDIGEAVLETLRLPKDNPETFVAAEMQKAEATGIPLHHRLAFYHRLAFPLARRDDIHYAIRQFAKACHDYLNSLSTNEEKTPYQSFLRPDFAFSQVFAPSQPDMDVIGIISGLTQPQLRRIAEVYGHSKAK